MEKKNKSVVLSPSYIVPFEKKVYGELTLMEIVESKIPKLDKEICLACYGQVKIKQMSRDDSGDILRAIINNTLFEGGQSVEDIDEFMVIILSDIYRDWDFMTTSEVAIAMRMGVREEFGELKGVNVRVLNIWLRMYNAKIKKEAMAKVMLLDKPKEKVVTDADKIKIRENWLNTWCDIYDQWLAGQYMVMIDPNSMFYKYMIKNNLMVLTEEEIAKMYKKAEIVFKMKHNAKSANGKAEKMKFKETLQKLQKGDESVKALILIEARMLYIWEYFNRLKLKNTTLRKAVSELNK